MMNRRFNSSSRAPRRMRDSSPGGATQDRSLDNPSDMSRKRVKFVGIEMDDVRHCGRDDTSRQYEGGAPKTSEYAYFKKVKSSTSCANPRALYKDDKRLKTSGCTHHTRETSNSSETPKQKNRDFRFSFLGEKEANHHSFISAQWSSYNEQDLLNNIKQKSVLHSGNITLMDQNFLASPFNGLLEPSGKQGAEEGIFSSKRQKIRQLVADTSCRKAEDLRGFDLVSSLLSRLFPKGNENSLFQDQGLCKGGTDTKHRSVTSDDSSTHEKCLDFTRTEKWNFDHCEGYFGLASNTILSDSDSRVTKCDSEIPVELSNYSRGSKANMIRLPQLQQIPFYGHFQRYESGGSHHLKGPEEYCHPTEYAIRNSDSLFLGWDLEDEEDKTGLCRAGNESSKELCPLWATSWNVDPLQSLGSSLGATALCSSSYFSTKYYLDFDSSSSYHPSCIWTQDIRLNLENEYAVAGQEEQALTLPCAPKYITLAEDCNMKDIFDESGVIISQRDPFLCMNKVSSDEHHDDLEALLLPRGLNRDLGLKCLPTTHSSQGNHRSIFHASQFSYLENSLYPSAHLEQDQSESFSPFIEGAYNHHTWSSNSEIFFKKLLSRPLLLNDASEEKSEEKYLYDGNELRI